MFVFNKLGFMMLFVAICTGILAGVPVRYFTDNDTRVTLIQAGAATIVLTVLDLAYRGWRHRELGWKRFFRKDTGGHLCFIPVWAYVPAMVVFGIISLCADGR